MRSTLAILVALFAGGALPSGPRAAATVRPSSSPASTYSPREIVAPWLERVPDLDGELADSSWLARALRTGPFVDDAGLAMRPYSDARIARTGDHLILVLYAADEDIRSSGPAADAFRVTLGDVAFEVTSKGELRSAPAGARLASDRDGTLDDSSDDDEEWVAVLAVPIADVTRDDAVGLRVERCDTPRGSTRRCGSTGALTIRFAPKN